MIMAVWNTLLSVVLVGLIVYVLFSFEETLIFGERLGLGMAGAAILMSIAAIWAHAIVTPYSVWYQWLWRLGWILFLGGKIYRLRRHRLNGERQKDIARSHFTGRL